ncbi:Transposase [Corynebacterium spheniscorum]|uniref:Transposase n=1 Tax=Corynebacterium spheniscorum TaxID=185761 RepID=A0A1I2VBP0_9CORY|nr:Transposase [Corynebacterium spheniscorum]
MPKRYPKEFRDDVIRVALARDRDVPLAQIAEDFGIHVGTLDKWLRQERIDNGEQEGVSRKESQELRQLRRRNRLLEQENEVLRRAAAYLSQANLPGKGSSRS